MATLAAVVRCVAGSSSEAGALEDWTARTVERPITRAEHGHILANVGVWSPDGAWIVYDCREVGETFDATRIERIRVNDGRVEQLFGAANGANCGVATWHPTQPRVVFILGPEAPTPQWSYDISRRRGVIVDATHPGMVRPLDAMNYAPPFTPGALRGGSHVHVFSADGERVSFTYDDQLVPGAGSGGANPVTSRRNIGVATASIPVRVRPTHPRNHDGDWFSVLVSRTVADPRPGSDEISRAAEEAWIGNDGYLLADGTRQRRALAFQGTVTTRDGRQHAEVFVADVPEDLTVAGDEPLEGTLTELPAPPHGVRQRRLTFTGERRYPGVAASPRHWLRSSPDGESIAFLMRDDEGRAQFWLVAPGCGALRQLTRYPWGVASTFTWSPDGTWLAHVLDNSVCLTDARTGRGRRLTVRTGENAAPHRSACVFSPDGRRIAFLRRVPEATGSHLQIHTVSLSDEALARSP